jgi:hypothetical protein
MNKHKLRKRPILRTFDQICWGLFIAFTFVSATSAWWYLRIVITYRDAPYEMLALTPLKTFTAGFTSRFQIRNSISWRYSWIIGLVVTSRSWFVLPKVELMTDRTLRSAHAWLNSAAVVYSKYSCLDRPIIFFPKPIVDTWWTPLDGTSCDIILYPNAN